MRSVLALVALICLVAIISHMILGGAGRVSLSTSPALSGQISQALGPGPDNSLPAVNRDYSLSVQRFSESDWVVARVQPIGNDSSVEDGYVIMKRTDGIFQAVFGPGTAISSAQLPAFPPDVNGYIQKHLGTFEPVIGQ